ncbi:MAG: hypothetical protein JXR46_15410 [Calditrichaceae bacterium]|nr:hypothetical protein [Calditrichaceae bacterium]MBN2710431.1 hypothetical protein [Calditrichaceae bacterium]RQV93631.1 MAG: hypothetical protein EH224_12225 [Calditrichota bacterium]
MNRILSLSFSDQFVYLVHGVEEQSLIEVVSSEKIIFPGGSDIYNIFSDENIDYLAGLIKKEKSTKFINDNITIKISLPFQYSYLKRIAVPALNNSTEMFSQVRWEFENYLPEKPDNYKVIKTDIIFEYAEYKEIVFIAILKDIIKQLVKLAEKNGDVLGELVLDVFCIERYLRINTLLDFSAVQVVLYVDRYRLTIHVYIGGKYYTTFVDPINPEAQKYSFEDKILEISKDRINQIQNLISQAGFNRGDSQQFFLYNTVMKEALLQRFNEEFDLNFIELPVLGQKQNESMINSSLESLGLMNIRTKL